MTREDTIGALMMYKALMLFDPLTGKTSDTRLENKDNQDLYYACEIAISVLSAEQMWISVNDALPKDSGAYLAYCGMYNGIKILNFKRLKTKCVWSTKCPVTHWMPLPLKPIDLYTYEG